MDKTDSFWFFATNEEKPEAPIGPDPKSECYGRTKRGVVLIFNHTRYESDSIPIRDGTDKDRDDLCQLFGKKLNFEVIVNDDLTYAKTYDVLNQVSRMDHTDNDCLIVIAMSHGRPNKIMAYDREYDVATLWSRFTPDVCPSLVGKPKLFFIQACRGTQLDHGVAVQSSIAKDARVNSSNAYTLPIMADILVMYSTVYGYYSWRSPQSGAYFVQSLIEQIESHANDRDLLTILTCVNRQVAVGYISKDDGTEYANCKQMCCFVSMLTKAFYFK